MTVGQVRQLRAVDGAQIVKTRSRETARQLFRADGVPVVIAARNEQDDLPATLLSLAASSVPVQTWVVVNGTTDDTAARAAAMGARVLECPVPSKMASLQYAVREITADAARGPILFTDADTLVGPRWAAKLAAAARSPRVPVVALGNAFFTHGDSCLADALRNIRKAIVSHRCARRDERIIAQGANLAIDFGGSRAALDSYLSIDTRRFIGEEEEIVHRMIAAGGMCRNVLHRDVAVITRGDRFALADLWRLRNDRSYSQRCARYQEYGDVRPYDASAVVLEAPVVLPRPAAPAPLRARPLVPETVGPRSR
ncbi:MAG: glycosyltransferase family 2 protein [Austwickia sp.]|nr:glycosyltransferase family 2 protein [Austwickia sp.]